MEVFVRLTPRSSSDTIEGTEQTADGRRYLKARVRAVPESGKANEALEKLLAKWFGVGRRDVSVVSGVTSRLKFISISGDPQQLTERLRTLEAEEPPES